MALADTQGFTDDCLQLTLGVRRQDVQGQSYNFANGERYAPSRRMIHSVESTGRPDDATM